MYYHSRARVDLRVMAVMENATFFKPPAFTEASPSDCFVSYTGNSLGEPGNPGYRSGLLLESI